MVRNEMVGIRLDKYLLNIIDNNRLVYHMSRGEYIRFLINKAKNDETKIIKPGLMDRFR